MIGVECGGRVPRWEPGDVRHVTSPDDPLVDDYRRLNDQQFRRRYERDELFIAEGFLAIERAIDSGHRVRSVLLQPSRVRRFAPRAASLDDGTDVLVAEGDVMEEIVGFDLHRGIVAAVDRRPPPTLAELAERSHRLIVLEQLNDGENIGAIARAARALGADGMIVSPTCADPYSRRSVRVSLGEILHLDVVRTDRTSWTSTTSDLAAHGFEIWALTPARDADDIWSVDVPDRLALLFGAEGPGLTPATMAAASRRVRIPLEPGVDSLNVGHAVAVALAVVRRS